MKRNQVFSALSNRPAIDVTVGTMAVVISIRQGYYIGRTDTGGSIRLTSSRKLTVGSRVRHIDGDVVNAGVDSGTLVINV